MEEPRPIEPTVRRASSGEETRTAPAPDITDGSALPTVIRGDSGDTLPLAAPPAVPATPRPFGRYLLEKELGRGGMGVVWKAWDTQLSRHVALKQILSQGGADEEQIQRFMREARLAAKLRHPHILPVHDVGEHEGQHYFTTDYIEGRTLDADMGAPIAPRTAAAHAKAIAEALAYAHENGVIHRDVKPSNVLLDAEGHAYVMDFGLAKEVDAAARGSSSLTVSGAILGTPRYMSPEQAMGAREGLSPATDQFSLGVLLHEMLAAQPLFSGSGMIEVLQAVMHREAPPPSRVVRGIPIDVDTICLKLLEKDPGHRYPSMREAVADLGRWLDGRPIEARPLTIGDRIARGALRHKGGVAVATVLLLAAAGTIAWVAKNRDELMKEREQGGKATQRALSAEEALHKAKLIAAETARWGRIQATIQKLEGISHDDTLDGPGRREAAAPLWAQVERFAAEAPNDPTSRAVSAAFAGWAQILAGSFQEGLARIREGARLDPDVPHGVVLEATVAFLDQLSTVATVQVDWGMGGSVSIRPPRVTPGTAEAKARIEALLARLRGTRVWGKETAEACTAAIEGLLSWEHGDFLAAEASLTRALGSADLAPIHSDLKAMRGVARLQRLEGPGAEEDFAASRAAWPNSTRMIILDGLLRLALSRKEAAAGRDPLPRLAEAVGRFRAARGLRFGDVRSARENEAFALRLQADWQADHGTDPRPALDEAIKLLTGLVDAGEEASLLQDRAMACAARAEWEATHGGDAVPWSEKAMADIDRSVELKGDDGSPWFARAQIGRRLALRERASGQDPRARLQRVLADLDEAAKRGSPPLEVRLWRALAWNDVGESDADASADPREDWRRSLEASDALLAERKDVASAWKNRGLTHLHLARWQATRETDPSPSLDRALADLQASLRLDPDSAMANTGLANVSLARAEWQGAHDVDPRAALDRALEVHENNVLLHPALPDLLSNLAAALLRRGEAEISHQGNPLPWLEKGIKNLDAAIEQAPSLRDARFNRATSLVLMGWAVEARGGDPRDALRKAIQDFDELARSSPDAVDLRYNRGNAGSCLARAESKRGNNAVAARLVQSAIRDLDEVLRRNPRHCDALDTRGGLQEAVQQYEKALADYQAALAIRPGDPVLQEHVRRVQQRLRK